MNNLVQIFLVIGFFILVYNSYSQNKPDVYPDLSLQSKPIPFVNLNNSQQLDSIYFYKNDTTYLTTRSYKYYNTSGNIIKSISFSRSEEFNNWWRSHLGKYSYDSNNNPAKKENINVGVIRSCPIIMNFVEVFDSMNNLANSNFFMWNIDRIFGLGFGNENYIYNSSGLLEKIEYKSWRGRFDLEETNAYEEYKYFEDGSLKECSNALWMDQKNAFVPIYKDFFTYDDENNVTLKVTWQWNGQLGIWEDFAKRIFVLRDNLTSRVDGYSYIDGIWELTSNTFYRYEDGNLVEYISKSYLSQSMKKINNRKETYQYNEQNMLIAHFTNRWDTINNTWVPWGKTTWNYNEFGNITRVDNYKYSASNTFELSGRKDFYWNYSDSLNMTKKYERINLVHIYPNPVRDWLTIKMVDGKFLPMTFNIFKISGELVLSGNINSAIHSINMDKQGSEMYILIIQSGNFIQSERILKL